MASRLRFLRDEPYASDSLIRAIRVNSRPLNSPDDLTPLVERARRARIALVGEASHGTSEFYTWRATLSRRLIEEEGFRFIAVEGDWPDCYRVNRFVKGRLDGARSARDVLAGFTRWPTWMWANEEIVNFADWLRGYNAGLPPERQVGFYGLDIYSLWDSLHTLAQHLSRQGQPALREMSAVLHCFEPFGEDAQTYARATMYHAATCQDVIEDLVERLATDQRMVAGDDPEAAFAATQNARVVKNAETYYRSMVAAGAESWNVRDRHMMETLEYLMNFHGAEAKAIVWEHNTHIGDARYTDMGEMGEVNVGQLARERYGEQNVVLIGFSSHRGRVIAGRAWDMPMEELAVPPGRERSWEDVLHRASPDNKMLIFDGGQPELVEPRGHRAIGVVYHPEIEHRGNYVPTILARRYDALLYLDETSALHPLRIRAKAAHEADDTFPSAV